MSAALPPLPGPAPVWDVYCRVVDNFGDIGVCWRLSRQLAGRGVAVRLWVDDPAALRWMAPQQPPAPAVLTRQAVQAPAPGSVAVLPWPDEVAVRAAPEGVDVPCGEVVIEAFGCRLPEAVEAALARRHRQQGPVHWFNLEYLSAEPHARRNNGLPSPVMSGPAQGLVKRFVFPGFEAGTAGLLSGRPADVQVAARQALRTRWSQQLGLDPALPWVSLFCYEPVALDRTLAGWQAGDGGVELLVTPGRAWAAVQQARPGVAMGERVGERVGGLRVCALPWLSQDDYDDLLCACDLNFVRGEDSLVRALWARRPFVWQAYVQDDGAHHAKVQALMDVLEAPPLVRAWHAAWNADAGDRALHEVPLPPWGTDRPALADAAEPADWQPWCDRVARRLGALDDLTTHLMRAAGHLAATD